MITLQNSSSSVRAVTSILIVFAFLLLAPFTSADVRELEIDTEQSVVKWLGKKVSGQHNGIVHLKEGTVSLENDKVVGGEFVLDMSSITNKDLEAPKWKNKLENHLKSDDFFNIVKFPEGKFKIMGSKPGKSEGEVILNGTLTIKNISHPVTFPATIEKKDGSYKASGKVTIDRTKWEIKYNSGKWYDPAQLGDKLIYDEIEIEVEVATKPS